MPDKTNLRKSASSFPDSLEAVDVLKGFNQDFIRELSHKVEWLKLEEGEILFTQGEDVDTMYFLIEGSMQTVIDAKGKKSTVKELIAGELAGLIAIMAGGKRNSTVFALSDSILAKINGDYFDTVLNKYPEIRANLLDLAAHRLRRSHLAVVLPEYFDEMDVPTFEYIESLFEWVHIKRGQLLYKKNDIGDSLFILVNGLLHVIDIERSAPNRVLALIDRGKIVGEMAMLSDEKRTASIYAARDCDLVKLSRAAFESISEQFPQVMMAITRILVDRLKNIGGATHTKSRAKIFTVLPITPGVPVADFTARLAAEFSNQGITFLLTPEVLDRFLNKKGISGISESDPRDSALRGYLAEIEADYNFIIYQADFAFTPWTRRCIKRTDHILLLAEADASPQFTTIEKEIEGRDDMTTTPRKMLVLLHPDGNNLPESTTHWLDLRNVRGHIHIRWDRDQDFGRLARIICNRAVGLVLGGGAAKGIAHIGVIRALEESGIPIDMVGGASMGSIIGAHYAIGNDPENMMKLCKKLFVDINPFNEYTLPLVSVMRGRKLEKMGKMAYGETEVEDLWLNYFCVSSNLTTSQVKVHRRGSLWKAVRTSSSIPGIITPVLEDGEVYVDGGVINNLPGDIMRRQCGLVIVVEVSPNLDLTTRVNEIPSPWKMLWRKIIPFKKTIKIPSIVDIVLSTVLTGSFIAANSVKLDADLSLTPPLTEIGFLDFKKMQQTCEIGYKYTMEILAKSENEGLLNTLKGKHKA